MGKNIITEIPFTIEMDKLNENLKLRNNKRYIEKVEKLIIRAKDLAKPKAIYMEAAIEDRGENSIIVDGIVFNSRALAAHTKDVDRVFPYVMTCGNEIEQMTDEIDDILEQYLFDGIKTEILMSTTEYISKQIKEKYGFPNVTYDTPGALEEWEMKEQENLFHLIGEVTSLIGVRLSDSFLMFPSKSVSGIYYEKR